MQILSKKKQNHIKLAKKIANQSDSPRFRHGAILVKGATIISASCNKNRFNSFGAKFRKRDWGKATLHAELGALLNIERKKTEGAIMYCVRINAQGHFRLAKPCHMCEAAMKYCGVKRVIYSTNTGFKIMKL